MLDPSWYPVSALQISADSIGSLSILRNRYTFAGSSIHKMASWFQLIQIQIDFRMISLDDLVRSQLADASGNCHWPHVQCATQWLSYHRCGHQLQWPVTTQEKTCHERSTVKLVAVFCELWLGMRTLVLQEWWCISTGMTSRGTWTMDSLERTFSVSRWKIHENTPFRESLDVFFWISRISPSKAKRCWWINPAGGASNKARRPQLSPGDAGGSRISRASAKLRLGWYPLAKNCWEAGWAPRSSL